MSRLPIDQPAFWTDRLNAVINDPSQWYKAIHSVPEEEWAAIQNAHRTILSRVIHPGDTVLDVGCRYGLLLDLMPNVTFHYVGVDPVPAFIALAQKTHPERDFYVCSLTDLSPLRSNRKFDVALSLSVEGMVRANLGPEVWDRIEAATLRIAKRLVLLGCDNPTVYTTVDPHDGKGPEFNSLNYIEQEHARMAYRLGLGKGCEIYDVFVQREYRRQGIATSMYQLLFARNFSTIYGFTKATNTPMLCLQRKLGFAQVTIPGFYEGVDGVFAYRNSTTHQQE